MTECSTSWCHGEAVEGFRMCARCQERGRQTAAKARERDAAKLNARKKAWAEKNREHVLVYQLTVGKERSAAWYRANLEKHRARCKAYREANLGELKDKDRDAYRANRETRIAAAKAYRVNNHEKVAAASRRSVAKNLDRYRARRRAYVEKRLRDDPLWKLERALRSRLGAKLRRCVNGKTGKGALGMRELGCTLTDLQAHLESLFEPGMSWANWSRHGWHIDHRRPLASFDLSKAEHRARAFHYTNLQPLWAIDNLRKGAKLLLEVA